MNIAIFTDYYAPSVGGTETAIENQIYALESLGHSVTVLTTRHPERNKNDDMCIEMRAVANSHGSSAVYLPLFGDIGRIAGIMKWRKIDIIHVQTDFTIGALGFLIARRLGVPIVYTVHTLLWNMVEELGLVERSGLPVAVLLLRLYARLPLSSRIVRSADESREAYCLRGVVCSFAKEATVVVTPSRHLSRAMSGWTGRTDIVTAPNFASLPARQAEMPRLPHFVWIGRIEDHKRPMVFVQAIKLVVARTSLPFRATIIGTGTQLDAIREQAANIEPIDVAGSVPYHDIPDRIAEASALVVTSFEFDNQPMVIAESLSAGRGVVCCDPNLTEGLDGGAGMFTAEPTAESLADTLLGLVENPESLKVMADNARASCSLFGLDEGVTRLVSVYKSALRSGDI